MIFLTFQSAGRLRLGVKRGNRVIDPEALAAETAMPELPVPLTPETLFRGGLEAVSGIGRLLDDLPEEPASESRYSVDESKLVVGPPVPKPGKIICIGRNYREHAVEMDAEVPEEPLLFAKFGNAIAASGQAIDITGLEQVDYEAELAVVVGKQGKRIAEADALDHVFGYCNANDLSERALQYRSSQFLIGKSLDGFLPIGPYLMTADELGDPQNLSIRGWLNGELRQESNTSFMLFPVALIISYVSNYMTLEPGDLILTGTPAGVIKGRPTPRWLEPGDEYVVEVGPLGRLRTPMTGG